MDCILNANLQQAHFICWNDFLILFALYIEYSFGTTVDHTRLTAANDAYESLNAYGGRDRTQ